MVTTRWAHPKKGLYRRADGKGAVNLVGPRDWSAVLLGDARIAPSFAGPAQPVGNGHSAREAMSFVDRAAPPCENCDGTGRHCGYHGIGADCDCAADCPDCWNG